MVDYSFYIEGYHGAMSEEEFGIYEKRASEKLAQFRRMYTVTLPEEDADKMAICAMADAERNFDLIANGEGGAVQSASIGSVSVSYGSGAGKAIDISPKGRERELYKTALLYLDIYRGIC